MFFSFYFEKKNNTNSTAKFREFSKIMGGAYERLTLCDSTPKHVQRVRLLLRVNIAFAVC